MIDRLKKRRRERARLRKIDEGYRRIDGEVVDASRAVKNRPFSTVIGPTNSAGQATLWAKALSKRGYLAQSLRISNDPKAEWFSADVEIPRLEWTAFEGRLALAKEIASRYDSVLLESMRPLFSLHSKRDYSAMRTFDDMKLLKSAGVRTAIVFHGSDIRDTVAHAKRETFSPYRHPSPELEQLQVRAAEFRAAGRKAFWRRIPVFVTTPDLLLDMPRARWLPVTIEVEKFANAGQMRPCWSSPGRPKVLFQPSKGWLKSADLVSPVLERLNEEGVIELLKNEPVKHEQMAAKIAQADIVIDRFDGIAGVASIEALAAKRLVIANLAQWAYKRAECVPPLVHTTPDTLESVLREISTKREGFGNDFNAGLDYARKWHDGGESAVRIVKALKLRKIS